MSERNTLRSKVTGWLKRPTAVNGSANDAPHAQPLHAPHVQSPHAQSPEPLAAALADEIAQLRRQLAQATAHTTADRASDSAGIGPQLQAIRERLDSITLPPAPVDPTIIDPLEQHLAAQDASLTAIAASLTTALDELRPRVSALEDAQSRILRQIEITDATLARLGSVVFGAAQGMERTRDAFSEAHTRTTTLARHRENVVVALLLVSLALMGAVLLITLRR
jgi:hypothetical protein